MLKGIIFDWDDVITLGSKEGYIKCLHDTLIYLDIHLDPEEEHRRILETWSRPHREEFKGLLRENIGLVDKACEIYEEKFFGNVFVDSLTLVDGVIELLERLKDKYILAVATGAHPIVLKDSVMPKFKIPNVFKQIISAYDLTDISMNKPAPYMLEKIMGDNNLNSSEVIYVGDAKTDVLMARNANVEPIVVLTGHLNLEEAKELNVKYILKNVVELESVLLNF